MLPTIRMSSLNDENMAQNTKPKRKNSEKRKEKSRFAARARRSHESEQFNEMAKCLPVPQSILQNMDKASVMRLAIGYIKLAHLTEQFRGKDSVNESIDGVEPQMLDTLNGFLLITSLEGEIIYVSKTIEDYIGLKQLDVIGNSIYEYTHPCDQKEVKDILKSKTHAGDTNVDCEESIAFTVRMKCTFTEKGKCVNLKSGNYKAMVITGSCGKFENTSCLLLTAEPMQSTIGLNTSGSDAFISKHTPDMKFTSIDECIQAISGFKSSELIGKSAYDYFHTIDVVNISKSLQDLYNKGQCRSGYYRFLAKSGGYFWLQTEATLITDNSGQPLEIVCVNYVISGVEKKHEIISEVQQEQQCSSDVQPFVETQKCNADELLKLLSSYTENTAETSDQFESSAGFPVLENVTADRNQLLPQAVPKPATATIFAPRTDDMNSGFIVFPSEDGDETILTDADLFDPEQDLTHLAPLAGDECDISLDLSNLPHLDGLMDDILKAMGLSSSDTGSLNPLSAAKNVVACSESDVDTSDNFTMECFAADDNKLMPYIPPAVVEEEIQFSCDDECGENDVRTESEAIDSNAVNSGPQKENSTNSYYNHAPLDDGGGHRLNSSDTCNSVSDKDGRSDHNLLTNDPFLSFTNGGLLENFQTRIQSKSPSLYSCGSKNDVFNTNASSVWDSPPPSSNNSTLTNDLDICSSLEDDLEPKSSHMPLSDDFPLLSDDSIWDSFINSNIGDIMNTDDLLPVRNTSEVTGSLNSKQPAPTLPLNSNLAMLLQGPVPVVRKTIGNITAKNGNKPPNVIVVEMSNCGDISSNPGVHKVVQMTRTQAAKSTTKSTPNYANVVYASVGDKPYVQTRYTAKRPCPMSPVAGQRRLTAVQSTNNNATNFAIVNGKRLKVVASPSPMNKSQPSPVLSASSVLMNLLVNGEDVNNGYTKCTMPASR